MSYGIVNIYASNDTSKTYSLWCWIIFSLPQAIWVMCKEFKITKIASNKIGIHLTRWPSGEHHPRYIMRRKLDFIDPNAYFMPIFFTLSLVYMV